MLTLLRSVATLAGGLVLGCLVAACGAQAPSHAAGDDATAPQRSNNATSRNVAHVAGRHYNISVQVPPDWTVGSMEQLQARDRANRANGDPFLTTEVVAVAGNGNHSAMLMVSLRQPPLFSSSQLAEVSSAELQQANAELRQLFTAAPRASTRDEIDIPLWELRQIEFKGESLRCLELTVLHRVPAEQGPADLWKTRRLYIPRPQAELQVETSYRVRDERRWLPALQAAVLSLDD